MTKKSKKALPSATRGPSADTSMPSRVSSPAATGGAGTIFEQHVNAYWLAQLLVRGIPPILHDCAVVEVHLQTEHLGWHTDDFLIVGEKGSGARRKLAGQVKRSFTVSAADGECKKAVQDFWKDFKNPQRFAPEADRFALVSLRGTHTLLEHFSGLLDCARAARDGAEFERRLATPGFVSAKAGEYCSELRTLISQSEGKSVSAAEIWSFLRVLHVLSLDLNSSTNQTEAAIKTLLAHTAGEQDAMDAAEATWNALLRQVGEGMPQARSFKRADLPSAVRRRHSPVGASEQHILRALSDHSALILDGIRSTIGRDLHLGRGRLVQQVIDQLKSVQVVLLSGAAGSGKSSIAKDALGILAEDHFAFSFRAEEFAAPHFAETLLRSQIPGNPIRLGALLAAQERKLLLVESVERLLEASTRDAFTDLLTLVRKDPSWRLILTCREYSADLVRGALLEASRVELEVVTVPPLDDGELKEVEKTFPTLVRPLSNAALRRLLRSPYVLDKALQIDWSEERPLPQSEREFRARFWQEIVRVDQRAAGGMPRRREEAFVQVALRRAQKLTLHAPCGDLDAEVLAALLRDSLIVSPQQSGLLAAPAHDVLEDWAILQWIDDQHATHDGSVQALSSALGTYPAVRRTYRKWVSELLERDPEAADRLFRAVVRETGLLAQFRDDTLVSLLRSSSSAEFLERHHEELFAKKKQLLWRVIHLLRVACVTTPTWAKVPASHASLYNVPDGPAWACVLRLVSNSLESFTGSAQLLLLGFIEDWARGVSLRLPYPNGSESVAAIAHWLLPRFDDYDSAAPRKRTLQVIAKIPNADPKRFAALLQRGRKSQERDPAAKELRELIFEGVAGMPAARDMPEVLVSVAKSYLLCSKADLRWERGYGGSLNLEPLFGIKNERSHGFLPASALRGPFLPLLRYHYRLGLDCLITIFNHSAGWYAHPRVPSRSVEPPFRLTLTFSDGTSRRQWCNSRLWGWYRGMSVGPYAIQSLLMALERWLLEFAAVRRNELDAVLLSILKQSRSAALTAVVASVATAFPHASGETLLVLLRSPLCFLLDRERLARELRAPSSLFDAIPSLDVRNRVYESERKEADGFRHRRSDLEMAILNLQRRSLAPKVHEILERHRAELPPVEEQGEEDLVWRLFMHRMDLRQRSVSIQVPDARVVSEGHEPPENKQSYVRLDLKEPEPDVKALVDQHAAQFQALDARASLLMWGLTVYERKENAHYDPSQWRQRLQEARAAGGPQEAEEEYSMGRGGPGVIAAVCVRDHWEELAPEERDWCVERVCAEVEQGDRWDHLARVQVNNMSADRPCASVLPLLLGKTLSEAKHLRVRQMLVVALTHAVDEVRSYAAWGIGNYLWTIDRKLVLRCINALAAEATWMQQRVDEERTRPLGKHRPFDELEAEAASLIRQRFHETGSIANNAYKTLDTTQWFGADANERLLTILAQAPTEAAAVAAFERLAHTLVGWWKADDHRQRGHEHQRERNFETELAMTRLLPDFLLRTSAAAAASILQPIVNALDHHPREVEGVLQWMILAEDRNPNTAQFWSLWTLFANKVRRAKWLAGIDGKHPSGREMMSAIFLGQSWKENVRHWRSLERGNDRHVHTLFEDLPTSSSATDNYLRFLYHIGEQSLPEAFIRIAKRLQHGNPRQMMRSENTVFMLEDLLQRYVYGKPLELKRQSELREAVLFLLDLLVELGSSAAFRMRDDFVTPLSAA
jgi:hypothetical protein